MKVNFDTNNSYKQNFGACRITDQAQKVFEKRFMNPNDNNILRQITQRLDAKGKAVDVLFDSNNGYLTAMITSLDGFCKKMNEDTFSKLFVNPIKFFEKCADEADIVEAKLASGAKLEKI